MLIAHFFLFYSFLMNTETTKNQCHNVYLFTLILDTGLNSHAYTGEINKRMIVSQTRIDNAEPFFLDAQHN